MIALTKKTYICTECNRAGKILLAVKNNNDLISELPKERIEEAETASKYTMYSLDIVKDEFGITLYKEAKKIPCEHCQSKNITWKPGDNEENVLNFYPDGEPGKWFRGFQDLSH